MEWTVVFVLVWTLLDIRIPTYGVAGSDEQCPQDCKCAPVRIRNGQDALGPKVTCHGLKHLDLSSIPRGTVQLVITDAGLTKVPTEIFSSLPNLIKIDFSKNKISVIEEGAFINLTSLEKLDFGDNSLTSLMPEMLSGLPLQVRINLEGNPLICDCQLKWVLEWIHSKRLRLSSKSTCQYPIQFRGVPINRMKKKDMHCKYPLQLPVLEIRPAASQLAFEGDHLSISCRVTRVDGRTTLHWLLDGQAVSPDPLGTVTVAMQNSSSDILESSLTIGRLHQRHSGSWSCRVETSKGNATRSVVVMVISGMADYCSLNTTVNNKGSYTWQPTIGGITVGMPCAGTPTSLSYHQSFAYHTCLPSGVWSHLMTAECPFVSEVTKVLEQFSKTNLNVSSKTVLETAKGLRNYTGDGSTLRDRMDVVFIARTLQNYLEYVPRHKEVGDILIDVISTVMRLDRPTLRDAQLEDGACSRMLRVVSSLAKILPDTAFSRYHDNLVVEEFLVKVEGFMGLRCTLYVEKRHKSLHCVSVNASLSLTAEKEVEASIYIPPSVISYLGQTPQSHKLQFVLYQDSRLFQRPGDPSRDVTSPVIATRAAHVVNQNVEVILKVPVYTKDVQPAWWRTADEGNEGDWVTEGCSIINISGPLITFTCTQLGTFGLLQDTVALQAELGRRKAQFRIGPPAIYVGSFVSLAAILAAIVIYCKAWKRIHLSKKIRHSLLNTWIATAALLLVYTLGILQVDVVWLCRGIGVIIHYLTLCALVWMLITVNNMYKKLKKPEIPETPSEETQPPAPKPMLRFYFVGWGVGIIVCGISAAVHIEKYGGQEYCFLSPGPSFSAVYGPVGLLLIFLFVYFLLVNCALHTEKETSLTPLVGTAPSHATQSLHGSLLTNLESAIDSEFGNTSQLRAHVAVLLLFCLTWTSAAISTARAFSLPFGELLFSLVYCLFSSILGLFVFGFFCYSRHDIWLHLRKVEVPLEQEEPALEIQEENPPDHAAPERVQDDQTTWNSCSEKLVNASPKPERVGQGVNRLIGRNVVEVFYNPRQSIVARRFFEKNRRRQQLKVIHKNNLAKEAAVNSEPPSYNKNSDSDQTNVFVDGRRPPLCTSHSYSGISSDVVFELKDKDLGMQTARLKASQKERGNELGRALPAWMAPSSRKETKGLVSEVTNSPPSLVGPSRRALSCCSDVTESSVTSQGRRRRRSRVRSKSQKPVHQHSWDDKYGRSQVFDGTPPDNKEGQRYRRKKRGQSACLEERFSRSQSAYEQIGKEEDADICEDVRQETSL